jgi:hypothetical protein
MNVEPSQPHLPPVSANLNKDKDRRHEQDDDDEPVIKADRIDKHPSSSSSQTAEYILVGLFMHRGQSLPIFFLHLPLKKSFKTRWGPQLNISSTSALFQPNKRHSTGGALLGNTTTITGSIGSMVEVQ